MPRVSVRADGSFVVAWQSNTGADGSGWGIYLREFGAGGVATAPDQLVNSYTSNSQERPAVIALDGGGFITLWHTPGVDGSDYGIAGRVYSPLLRAVGDSADNLIDYATNTVTSVIDGGLGADTMSGGTGDTIYIVDNVGDSIIEQPGGGIDEVQSSVSFTLADNVENLLLVGSSNLDATGNALANLLIGNGGDNSLSGGAGADTLSGADGNDQLQGGDGNDVLSGGNGNDVLSGGAGNDTIDGGAG
ncbi:MAG: hypothetical protein CFE32_20650, partial [Alphaproteobacteria bacterium PA3]